MKIKLFKTMYLEKKDVAYLLVRGKNPFFNDRLWNMTLDESYSNSIHFTDPELIDYVDGCKAILAVDEMENKSDFELEYMEDELKRKSESLSQRKGKKVRGEIDDINYQIESIQAFRNYEKDKKQ